jgi:hypothetical protein
MGRDIRPPTDPASYGKLTLLDFIPAISPKFDRPIHLARNPPGGEISLIDALQGVIDGTIKDGRFVCAIPVRHAKTLTILHAIALILARDPSKEIMYISYGANFAQRNSRKARRFAVEAGVIISKDHNTIQEWVTEEGGQVLATGIDGEFTGRGADVIFVDDPIKNREQAMSHIVRDVAGDAIEELETRLNPGGSIFIVAARFHEDDPSGRQLKKTREADERADEHAPRWIHIHHRAIEDEGLSTERALWPEKRPLPVLKRSRAAAGPYLWAANYQGDPRPAGDTLFGIPGRFDLDDLPVGLQIGIGVDLSYTAGRKSDRGAIVVLGRLEDVYYVLYAEAFKLRIDFARHRMRFVFNRWPGAQAFSYVSGTERGPIILLAADENPVTIIPMAARYNKLVRASKMIEHWNGVPDLIGGTYRTPPRVLVPHRAPWLAEFLGEYSSFTGEEGGMDDLVDAGVSVFDALAGMSTAILPGLAGRTDRHR